MDKLCDRCLFLSSDERQRNKITNIWPKQTRPDSQHHPTLWDYVCTCVCVRGMRREVLKGDRARASICTQVAHTQTLSDVRLTLQNLFDFIFFSFMQQSPFKSNSHPFVWLTSCPLVSFQRVEFHRPWAKKRKKKWKNEWEGVRRNAAKVITWFRLSWFWFKRGRVCQRNSRHSPVSISCQIFEERSESEGWRHRMKEETNWTKRDRDCEAHPMPMKWGELTQRDRDTIEKMSALQGEKG